MSGALVAIGVIVVLIGAVAIAWPARLTQLARKITVDTRLRIVAFVIRTALGALLILVAPTTGYPLTLQVIGVLLIVSGVAVLLIGNARIQKLLSWALSLGRTAIVVGGIVGVVFGAFLVYAGL